MRIYSALFDPALLDLPWDTPLEQWPADQLVALPRGLSRHVVRFVRLGQTGYAVKETGARVADREYDLLRALERRDFPSVQAVAIVSDRVGADGEPLDPILVTRHLQFSLPYRALFAHILHPETLNRLLDALAWLLARAHLGGFFWGDCSLSNTLFRRDAGAFAAYLVDAETSALHPSLSNGQRGEDLEIARVNIYGETLDLAAAGLLDPTLDPERIADGVCERYQRLWHEVTYEQVVGRDDRHQLEKRIHRLNELGFDVAEVHMSLTGGEGSYAIRPKVVDSGHHRHRLQRLTGLDTQENQARRLLNDLDAFRAGTGQADEAAAAPRWLTEVFEPVVRAVPPDLRGKLEAPELFVEVADHRWRLSEDAGRDVGLEPAIRSYISDVLVHRPDEQAVLP